MKRKILNIIVISTVVSILVLGLVMLVRAFAVNSFSRRISYRYRYRECEPQKLLLDLERTFDINFPTEIKYVKCARTPGSWDSTASSFAVKFSADPAVVDRFLESFPKKIRFEEYTPPDTRYSSGLRTPEWFTEPITRGKAGLFFLPVPKMEIYVDTKDENNFLVYLGGHYHGSLREIKEELKKD